MLLERMVHFGSVCIHRLAEGCRGLEVKFHRLIHNPKVKVPAIFAEAAKPTVTASAGRHVLAIQDTSEINFRTHAGRLRDLGRIAKGVGRGILLHPMIAVDADSRDCLGLVGGQIWTRDPDAAPHQPSSGTKKKSHGSRKLGDKESRRWIETALAAKSTLCAAACVTFVADQEADIYHMWASVAEKNIHVLGRAYQDRRLVGGRTLFTIASTWPLGGTRPLRVRERPDRPEREVKLEVRFGKVTLCRPRQVGADDGLPDRASLTLIEVTELSPPEGAEPLHWRLLTTHEVAGETMAWQVVDWYRCRWIIEQFFRILKTQGLKLEDSQMDHAEHLIRLTAVATRAAIITLQLTQARDGSSALPAMLVFSPDEMAMLEKLNQKYTGRTARQCNPFPFASLPWAAWILGRLGGWDGYPSSRPPGPITFKRGLDALKLMAEGWALRDLCMP